MKNLLTTLLAIFLITNTFAQAPEKMKYQAVIRDSNGHVVTNQAIGMQISILQGDLPGTVVYTETQSLISNANGLTSTEIGTGTAVLGNFSTIDWTNGPFFLQIATDPTGGTSYTITGTNQLLSVPYAMHAKTADSLTDIDSFSWSITGNVGTDPSNNFIGTTDDQPLILKVNNIQAGEVSTGNNTAFGLEAGVSHTTGVVNTAYGYQALYSNTTGNHNTATGNIALYENTTGQRNTATGSGTLQKNETGTDNTAIGFTALHYNTTGNENTATGKTSLFNNTTGNNNTAHGKSALYYNSTGSENTAMGYKALVSNTSGNSNIAIGNYALYSSTTNSNVVAIGDSALYNNGMGGTNPVHGYQNTAVGSKALYSNTIGSSNTANGINALYSNIEGYENSAFGEMTLYSNIAGHQNTAVGADALYSNIDGYYNTGVGRGAGYSNTTGFSNTSVGRSALFSTTIGDDNTAVGNVSMYSNTSGYENTAIGKFSLYKTTTAGRNVAVGYEACFNNWTGFYNTAVGWGSGPNTHDHKNTTAIGRGATTTAWNQVRIGNNIVTSIGGYAGWSNISDKRFKKEIQNDIVGLEFILALEPVSYQLDMDKLEDKTENKRHTSDSTFKETEEEREFNLQSKLEKGSIRQSGFLAQDVELAANSVGYEFSGVDKPKNEDDFYGLRYAEFVVPLVKAVQEQQELIELLKTENQQMKENLEKVNSILEINAQK